MSKGSIRRQYARQKDVNKEKVKKEQTEKFKTREAAQAKKTVKEGIMIAAKPKVEEIKEEQIGVESESSD